MCSCSVHADRASRTRPRPHPLPDCRRAMPDHRGAECGRPLRRAAAAPDLRPAPPLGRPVRLARRPGRSRDGPGISAAQAGPSRRQSAGPAESATAAKLCLADPAGAGNRRLCGPGANPAGRSANRRPAGRDAAGRPPSQAALPDAGVAAHPGAAPPAPTFPGPTCPGPTFPGPTFPGPVCVRPASRADAHRGAGSIRANCQAAQSPITIKPAGAGRSDLVLRTPIVCAALNAAPSHALNVTV